MTHELYSPLAEDVHFVISYSVIFRMLTHSEAEGLTDNIIEGNGQEIAAEQEQTQSIYSIKLAPLGFILENFIDLNRLAALSDLDREGLFFALDLKLSFLFFIVHCLNAFELETI